MTISRDYLNCNSESTINALAPINTIFNNTNNKIYVVIIGTVYQNNNMNLSSCYKKDLENCNGDVFDNILNCYQKAMEKLTRKPGMIHLVEVKISVVYFGQKKTQFSIAITPGVINNEEPKPDVINYNLQFLELTNSKKSDATVFYPPFPLI